MQFSQRNHDLFIPDLASASTAARRTTHLGIGAHQDDLEFMALHGILAGYQNEDQWFGGVTCTDGAGSSRSGEYADYSDDEMRKIRAEEQRQAARVGQYSFVAQLGHPSSQCKNENHRSPLSQDLLSILESTTPEVIYTHNPFDKHPTHLGVLLATLDAIAHLPPESKPKRVYGCEVWRGLDWLPDDVKVVHDVSPHSDLAIALTDVFQSQSGGGKRYDLAVEGRRRANATFYQAHSVDGCDRVQYAIDLTDLTTSGEPVHRFADRVLEQFRDEVLSELATRCQKADH